MIKAYRPLQEAYRKIDLSTEEWIRITKPPFTRETANKIVRRGDQAVNGVSLAFVSLFLGFKLKDIVEQLAAYGKELPAFAPECETLIEMISPVDLTKDEQAIIKTLRKKDAAKQKLISDMIKSL